MKPGFIAVTGFVRRPKPVDQLEDLAYHLSGPPGPIFKATSIRVLMGPWGEKVVAEGETEYTAACATARKIVSACAGLSPDEPLPPEALQMFSALADGVTFTYYVAAVPAPGSGRDAWLSFRDDMHRAPYLPLEVWLGKPSDSPTRVGMHSSADRGLLVKALVDYFLNPSRERLKECPRCQSLFVDRTRNKAKLRCSPGCTAAWWNRDRRKDSLVRAGRWRAMKRNRKGTK